jgi:hypothetical protein
MYYEGMGIKYGNNIEHEQEYEFPALLITGLVLSSYAVGSYL